MAICLLALLVPGACGEKPPTGAAASETRPRAEVHPVSLATVAERAFPRVLELEGSLDPAERVLVAPAIPGVIKTVTKRAGDRIKKDELLVEVDPKEVYVGTIPLRVQIAAAQAQASAAGEVLRRLDEPLARLRKLYEARAVSKTELDQVEIPYVKARAERDAAQSVIGKVNGELGIAYSKLSETKILAPFDGFVVRRLADPGESARAFPPTVVLVLTRHDPLYLQAEVLEEDIARLRSKQEVAVTCDAYAGEAVRQGTLEEIIPYVNPMTRTATIRVRVDNRDGKLMPGMSARLRIVLGPQTLLAVPQAALATEPLDQAVSVFVVGEDGKARERRIRYGRSLDGYVAVATGLRAGERVVVKGHEPLVDGAAVRVVEGPGAAGVAGDRR
jgi:RND family efflux transporter MFP subunit